jgi:hypothetical protein
MRGTNGRVFMAHPMTDDAYARFRLERRRRWWHVAAFTVQTLALALCLLGFYLAIVLVGPMVAGR